jgi:ribosome-associated translation inhibitor RaiA
MEQLLFFGLGVTSVFAVAGVVAMFRSQQKIADMQSQIDSLERSVWDTNDSVQKELDELDRQLDSRLDKLEARFDSRFTDHASFVDGILESVDKVKQKLKERTV